MTLQHFQQGILCIVSRTEDAELCNLLGVDYVWHPNEQLGAKWNFGLSKSRDLEWDFLVTLGSDDIIKESLFEYYEAHPDHDVLITDKIHFIDIPSGRATILLRARIGAGRRISRKAIEKCNFKLWTDEKNKSLDMDSNTRLSKAGFVTSETRTISHICGLKSATNIWSYDHIERHGNSVVLDTALEGIPDYIKGEIISLLPDKVKSVKFAKP